MKINKTTIAYMSPEQIEQINEVLDLPDLYSQYEYIYNKACEELDEIFVKNNYCDYKKGECACQRNESRLQREVDGRFFKLNYSKEFGFKVDAGLCYKVDGKTEAQKCISAKFFTCKYLKRLKVKVKPDDIFLIKVFFNNRQKVYIQRAFFQSQKQIIQKLVKMNTKL